MFHVSPHADRPAWPPSLRRRPFCQVSGAEYSALRAGTAAELTRPLLRRPLRPTKPRVSNVVIGKRIGPGNRITCSQLPVLPTPRDVWVAARGHRRQRVSLTAAWRSQSGQIVDQSVQTVPPKGENAAFDLSQPKGFEPGTYKVVLFLGGDSVDAKLSVVRSSSGSPWGGGGRTTPILPPPGHYFRLPSSVILRSPRTAPIPGRIPAGQNPRLTATLTTHEAIRFPSPPRVQRSPAHLRSTRAAPSSFIAVNLMALPALIVASAGCHGEPHGSAGRGLAPETGVGGSETSFRGRASKH